ncbi:hypothetical protein EDD17DRAFT_1504047 [Pisolithus thermaeus]|nr:hypothetical protein EDD17DRAFT_1504047 [Pisolithus thermaeus]
MDGPVKEIRAAVAMYGLAVRQHSSWKGQAACEEGCHNTWAGLSIVKYQMDNSCTGPATIWSETAQLMEGPLRQTVLFMHWPGHDVESDGATHGGASAAGGKGRRSSWAGLSIVKPQTVLFMHWPGHDVESDGATHGGASVAGGKGQRSSWAGPSIVKPQTVLFMHWPGHDVESDGATHGGASAAGGKGRRTSWAGPSIVKHQTVQLMHWPGNDMESDGATNGGASAAGEEGRHSSWAGPSIVKHQTIELMLWPGHDGESDGAAHGGASAAAAIWNEMVQLMEGPVQQVMERPVQQSPAKSASASPQIMGGASAEGVAAIWSEREIFRLSLISLSSSSFPVTSQICISIPADHGGAIAEVTSQMCFGIPAVDGGAGAADEGRGQSSWAGTSMVNHPKIQLMYWHGHDMDLISLSSSSIPEVDGGAGMAVIWSEREIFCLSLISLNSSSFPVTSQMCFGIPAVDGGACAADEGRGQSSWAGPYNTCTGMAAIWSGREIFCLSLISLSSSSFPVTSQMCFGIPAVDGGAGAAGGGGWQNSWACPSMANHQKIQLMHWRGRDMDLISLSSSSCPGTSPSCIGILTIDGGASAAGEGGWQNEWVIPPRVKHQRYNSCTGLATICSHNSLAILAAIISETRYSWMAQYDGYVPTGWRMQLTDKIADYMKSLLSGGGPSAHCEKVVAHATKRRQTKETVESLQYPEIMAPTVIVDGSGNVNLWYLPGALDGGHQRQIWNSLSRMAVPLKDSIKPSGTGGWRKDKALFQEMADLKGSIDLSPGWYQQGRGVRDSSFRNLCVGDMGTAPELPP